MKLHEVISLEPEKTGETSLDYQERLRDRKIKHLASGSYATVYKHPTMKPIVVKVSDDDSQAITWLKFVVQHQDNPYVPKVYDLRRYKPKTGLGYFIAMMERLKEYRPISTGTKKALLRKHLGDVSEARPIAGAWWIVHEESEMNILRQQAAKAGVPSKHLMEVLEFLHHHRYSLDIHDGNIMVRGKDQIVFTDPLE